ncbi:O-Antigen ligase [Fodinibius salinus]|uniref:O-Antigen ligase n=1 Tax=Fodinibius salinus TaxID=860790 RepID=A0A5D3YQQ6_9BACT|nr:O-antigen ligase family protein [Fodinibius salinus]TYP95323.1 O-Antigen ligase [Fodinibius salinus]
MKWSLDDVLLLALICYVILLPALQYEPYRLNDTLNNRRLLQVGLLLLVNGISLLPGNLCRLTAFINEFTSSTRIALGGIILLGLVASMRATFLDWALLDYGHYLLLLTAIFAIGAVAYENPSKALGYVLVGVIGFVVCYLARVAGTYVLYQLGEFKLWPSNNHTIDLFGFSSIRTFNHTQTWSIPILVSMGWYAWRYSAKQWLRWGLAAVIVGWGMLVFASGARGVMLGVVVGTVVIWAFFVEEKRQFFSYCGSLVVCTLLGYFLFFELFAGGTEQTVMRANSSNRLVIWGQMLPEIFNAPFIGYGPMHYAVYMPTNMASSPHNWFLQFAYEWGIPVAIMLFVLFINGLKSFGKQLVKNINDQNYMLRAKWLKLGLLWSMVAALVHGFFTRILVTPISQMLLVLVVGASLGVFFAENPKEYDAKSTPTVYQWITVFVILGSIASVSYWPLNNQIDRHELDSYYLKKTQRDRLLPRYWMQGIIGFDYSGMEQENKHSKQSEAEKQ